MHLPFHTMKCICQGFSIYFGLRLLWLALHMECMYLLYGPALPIPSEQKGLKASVNFMCLVRPWSVDSLNGGTTDVMEKPPIEKKSRDPFFLILASRLYLWNYWPYKNGSTIKIYRILSGKQADYFQDDLLQKSH